MLPGQSSNSSDAFSVCRISPGTQTCGRRSLHATGAGTALMPSRQAPGLGMHARSLAAGRGRRRPRARGCLRLSAPSRRTGEPGFLADWADANLRRASSACPHTSPTPIHPDRDAVPAWHLQLQHACVLVVPCPALECMCSTRASASRTYPMPCIIFCSASAGWSKGHEKKREMQR